MIRFVPMVLVACAATSGPADLQADPGHAMIYNGELPVWSIHDAAVALYGVDNHQVRTWSYCTGTLIAPDIVLTAAHCLDLADGGAQQWIKAPPHRIAVYVGDRPQVDKLDHLYAVKGVALHPQYDRWTVEHDIGLLRLTRSVTEVAPVPHLPVALALGPGDAGIPANHAGFGYDEFGGYDVKKQITIPIAGPGCVVPGCQPPYFPETTWSYSMANGGPCDGDSGGPSFIQRSGDPYVAGITSIGDYGCELYGVQTKVDAYAGAIETFIALQPPAPDAVGFGACGDATCNQGESCDGRGITQPCPGDCPSVLQGPQVDQFCWVGNACLGQGCTP